MRCAGIIYLLLACKFFKTFRYVDLTNIISFVFNYGLCVMLCKRGVAQFILHCKIPCFVTIKCTGYYLPNDEVIVCSQLFNLFNTVIFNHDLLH